MHYYQFSDFTYNPDTRELSWQRDNDDFGSKYLRKKVADVLCYLLENRERVVSKDELLQHVWHQGEFRENSLLQSIRELRKLFGESAQSPSFIRTVHLKGYQWIYADVSLLPVITAKPITTDSIAGQADSQEEDGKESAHNKSAATKSITTEISASEQNITGNSGHKQKIPVKIPVKTVTVITMVILLVITLITWQSKEQIPTPLILADADIAVLPFINDTGDSELQWLELGYSDMFAQGLRKITPLQVIPTYHLQGAMAIRQLDKRLSDSEQISGLLNDIKVKYAIAATINKDGQALRFNYRLHDVQGVFASGSIRFPNLPSSLPALISQVVQHFPQNNINKNDLSLALFTNKEAQQDYAKGMQALQTKGAKLAKRYFEAALLNEPNNLAATTKLADTLSLLAESKQAQFYYRQVMASPALVQDDFLASSVYLGLAKLLIQQQQLQGIDELIAQGLAITEDKALRYQRAELLRTKAKLLQIRGENNQRHQLLSQADALSRPFASLQNEADALYYLGSPTNIGLEIDPDINLRQNQDKLNQALEYYQGLGNKRGEALTQLAIGQNYYFDVAKRLNALQQAKALFIQTGNRFELVDTLNYTGYFFIQYHRGDLARQVLEQAISLVKKINDPHREQRSYFLYAFSALDQGINNEGNRSATFLTSAIKEFNANIEKYAHISASSVTADSHLLLAWAYSESGLSTQAIPHMELALKTYQSKGYPVSIEYAKVSLMDEYIKLKQWHKVTSLANSITPGYLTNIYAARAYYELDNAAKAQQIMADTKVKFDQRWTTDNEQRLSFYTQRQQSQQPRQNKSKSKNKLVLDKVIFGAEISSHLNYCESLWSHENIDSLIPLTTPVSKDVFSIEDREL